MGSTGRRRGDLSRYIPWHSGNGSLMPNTGDVHVVPGEGGWRVEVEGSVRPRSRHKPAREPLRTFD